MERTFKNKTLNREEFPMLNDNFRRTGVHLKQTLCNRLINTVKAIHGVLKTSDKSLQNLTVKCAMLKCEERTL